ncbi:olfactory receptor 6C68-like [Sorex araneus]|uniref:olfactory receptor 6C68-like n=1 Tax=Sorex araneus TaxID=42254 RepID=UPI00243369E0|nr:olfactory receptor 6C68-like [Sorex araneus]
MKNHTAVTTFILLGLTDDPQLQVLLFIFLLITYMLSAVGNLTIVILIFVDAHLKTAMYYFLQNFSFLEISFTSACIPRFLYSIATGDRTITYNSCICQLFFADLFAIVEFFLLATMSYDRYVAICKPLHYMTIMNPLVCKKLISGCWIITLFLMIPPLGYVLTLDFCDSEMDHFLCDAYPLLKISCSDSEFIEKMVLFSASFILFMTLTFVVWSYGSIIRTILGFPSAQQKKKAFSTCSSHMIVVSITYGSCIFIYIKPSAKDEMNVNKGVFILATSISPMLNPFIYTLRNKQVKNALSGFLKRLHCSQEIKSMIKKTQKSGMRNHTTITIFIFLGLTDESQLQILLSIFLLITYMLSLVGNMTIIILTFVDSHLKSGIFLYSIATGDRTITYNACTGQVFFTDLFEVVEFFLLATMSYDRYVVICKPFLSYDYHESPDLQKTLAVGYYTVALNTTFWLCADTGIL